MALSVKWGAVNPTRERSSGWIRVPAVTDRPTGTPQGLWAGAPGDRLVLPVDGTLTVAEGVAPVDRYRRVMAAVPTVTGWLDGRWRPIVSHIEPIALPVDVRDGDEISVVLELIVLRAVGGSGHEIFVRDARVVR